MSALTSLAPTAPPPEPPAAGLAPPAEGRGLWALLQQQALGFASQAGGGCQIDLSLDIAAGLPGPEGAMAFAVLRIFDEMLGNVARHARASRVEIRISAHASDLTLVVKDNGRGAPPSAFERSDARGVAGMHQRAAQFGGWLHISSHIDQGTTVILTMPRYQSPRPSRPTASGWV